MHGWTRCLHALWLVLALGCVTTADDDDATEPFYEPPEDFDCYTVQEMSGTLLTGPDACPACDYSFALTLTTIEHVDGPCMYGYGDGVEYFGVEFANTYMSDDPEPMMWEVYTEWDELEWVWVMWWDVYPDREGHDVVFSLYDGYVNHKGYWDIDGDQVTGLLYNAN